MGVKAYTGEEIAQGAKSGEWTALNKKNGASFHPTAANALNANESVSVSTPTSSANVTEVSVQSVLPSQHMRLADLGPVKIEYPENWQVNPPRRKGQSITIAPQAGVVADGVGYGVILNGVAPSQDEHMSIDDLTRQLIQDLEQNEALQLDGDLKPIVVDGVEGRSVALHSISPFPETNGRRQRERDWLVTVPRRDGSFIFMVFVAPLSQFEQFRPTYEEMLKSMHF
jgi:hypothetical protein